MAGKKKSFKDKAIGALKFLGNATATTFAGIGVISATKAVVAKTPTTRDDELLGKLMYD